MILINLLPHREAKRKRRQQAFLAGLGAAALVGALVVGAWYGALQQMIGAQQARNNFLGSEIAKLDAQIKDVATLKAEIEALKARQKAVEDLQLDRNIPVHLLNELVNQTPEGVYLTRVAQDAQQVSVTGVAQTNERVSEFLRNTANRSRWLERPELVEIKSANLGSGNRDSQRLFDFNVKLTLKRPQEQAAAAAHGASAPKTGVKAGT